MVRVYVGVRVIHTSTLCCVFSWFVRCCRGIKGEIGDGGSQVGERERARRGFLSLPFQECVGPSVAAFVVWEVSLGVMVRRGWMHFASREFRRYTYSCSIYRAFRRYYNRFRFFPSEFCLHSEKLRKRSPPASFDGTISSRIFRQKLPCIPSVQILLCVPSVHL